MRLNTNKRHPVNMRLDESFIEGLKKKSKRNNKSMSRQAEIWLKYAIVTPFLLSEKGNGKFAFSEKGDERFTLAQFMVRAKKYWYEKNRDIIEQPIKNRKRIILTIDSLVVNQLKEIAKEEKVTFTFAFESIVKQRLHKTKTFI